MTPTIIILIIGIIVILYVVFTYNSLVRLKNNSKEASADIDVQLKRRFDLIPNLVNTVKGYATHESGTLEKIVEARAKAMNPSASMGEKMEADNMISGALKSIFALSENYPDLKASQNFHDLTYELSDTENKIQASRRFYNDNVNELNVKIETFPSNIIAKTFGFNHMDLFSVSNVEEKEAVKVQF